MPTPLFQKGNKLGKGGRRPGAGGPTREKRRVKKLAAELAKEYIEKHVNSVLGEYKRLAVGGIKRRKHHPKTGQVYYEREWDSGNQRHWIDKLVPATKQELEISGGLKVVKVDSFDPEKTE